MKNKQLSIVAEDEVVTLSYFEERARGGLIRKKKISVKNSDLPYPDDFIYACAYLIDEFAKDLAVISPETPTNKAYEGRTVCVASPDPEIFKAGKIYEWKDGRTIDEKGSLLPKKAKLYSLDEITNPALKFLELVEG